MEVILMEKVIKLGNIGDKVNVRPGYGRNFLIPQNKAVPASADNIAHFEARRAELEAKAAEVLAAAQARFEKLQGIKVEIVSKAGDEGKLYGSIGTRDIADAVTAAGVELAKNEVRMPAGAIRQIGDFELEVQLHPDVVGNITVNVVAE